MSGVRLSNVDGEEIIPDEWRAALSGSLYLGGEDFKPPAQGTRVRIKEADGKIQGFALNPVKDGGRIVGWTAVLKVELEGTGLMIERPGPPALFGKDAPGPEGEPPPEVEIGGGLATESEPPEDPPAPPKRSRRKPQ